MTQAELQPLDRHRRILLDQVKTVDKGRFVKCLGKIYESTQWHVLAPLAKLFAPKLKRHSHPARGMGISNRSRPYSSPAAESFQIH